jgi:hypothetical protein
MTGNQTNKEKVDIAQPNRDQAVNYLANDWNLPRDVADLTVKLALDHTILSPEAKEQSLKVYMDTQGVPNSDVIVGQMGVYFRDVRDLVQMMAWNPEACLGQPSLFVQRPVLEDEASDSKAFSIPLTSRQQAAYTGSEASAYTAPPKRDGAFTRFFHGVMERRASRHDRRVYPHRNKTEGYNWRQHRSGKGSGKRR